MGGYVFTGICLLTPGGGVPQSGPAGGVPHLAGGDTSARSRWGEGTPPGLGVPQPGPARGVSPLAGGVPVMGYPPVGMGYPLARSGWGYPRWGTPGRDGVPPSQMRMGVPKMGYPLAGMGVPPNRTADGALDMARSVYLLRSRRRTFFVSIQYFTDHVLREKVMFLLASVILFRRRGPTSSSPLPQPVR